MKGDDMEDDDLALLRMDDDGWGSAIVADHPSVPLLARQVPELRGRGRGPSWPQRHPVGITVITLALYILVTVAVVIAVAMVT
jgi:hypothetical protein